jgi:WhiB family redox-sensing transcriptional regulator
MVEKFGPRPWGAPNMGWLDHANCRYTSPELFFPIGGARLAAETIRAAKAVCDDCEVRDACLQFALETNQDSGIWGGTSEEERRRFRPSWLAGRRHRTR